MELLAWEHTSIRKLAKDYPQLAENALRIVVSYLKSYSDRHAGLVATSAQQRLAAALLNLGHRTGRVNPHGVEVETTNAQLGALADLSPFTTSRVLGRWERDGSVSKARGKVLIHSPEALIVD